MKKNETPKPIFPQKHYYDITVEVLAPVTLSYRAYAENTEEALALAEKLTLPLRRPPLIHFARAKKLKATIYTAGSSLIQLVKNYL